ncbi:hypothetical protein LZL87_008794 [Fusarium oxysporum]|nr:hypothetical protein LZL87_008794 [Fusarium oxysporum]
MVDNGIPESNITRRGPKEMPEPVSQNKHSFQGEPQGDQSKSEQGQSDEDDSKENKPSKDEANEKSAKKVRFQEDSQRKDPEKKKSHNEDNHKVSAPTSSNISLWDAETIKELNNCLIEAKTTLKRVQERVKEQRQEEGVTQGRKGLAKRD